MYVHVQYMYISTYGEQGTYSGVQHAYVQCTCTLYMRLLMSTGLWCTSYSSCCYIYTCTCIVKRTVQIHRARFSEITPQWVSISTLILFIHSFLSLGFKGQSCVPVLTWVVWTRIHLMLWRLDKKWICELVSTLLLFLSSLSSPLLPWSILSLSSFPLFPTTTHPLSSLPFPPYLFSLSSPCLSPSLPLSLSLTSASIPPSHSLQDVHSPDSRPWDWGRCFHKFSVTSSSAMAPASSLLWALWWRESVQTNSI